MDPGRRNPSQSPPEPPPAERTLPAAQDATLPASAPPLEGSSGHFGSGHPDRVEGYVVIRPLASGGMGTVYEAEQLHPRRKVALKVVKAGLTTPSMLRRFEFEAQVLARLHHPGIAQIHEAGTFDTGMGPQPFFAMEFVEGEPLNRFAEGRDLPVRDKLKLIAEICDAVEHAHQKGIIHRDLKPGNILVTAGGRPKILDFGLARAAGSESAGPSMHTEAGQLLGTILYMSPEQSRGEVDDVDTRSDVYALGVIAYQLLAGRLPFETEGVSVVGILFSIAQAEPAPISSLDRRFAGDIETILGKAMEKDKARRYQSAGDLAEDIRRHLRDEPVSARPPGGFYQVSKFARRHKALVAGMAAVIAALVLGLAGTAWQAARARAESERAGAESLRSREEARKAAAMFTFSMDMLKEAARKVDDGEPFTYPGLLQTGAELAQARFGAEPEIAARIHQRLAGLFGAIPRLEDEIAELARAREAAARAPDPPEEFLLRLQYDHGAALRAGRGDESGIELMRSALERARSSGAWDPALIRNTQLNFLSTLLDARMFDSLMAETGRLLEEERRARPAEGERPLRPLLLSIRAIAFARMGRPEEGLEPSREAMESVAELRDLRPDEYGLWIGWPYRAGTSVLETLGRHGEAEALFKELEEISREKADKPALLAFKAEYSVFLDERRPSSEETLRVKTEILELCRELTGRRTMRTVYALSDLIKTSLLRNEMDNYAAYAAEALEVMEVKLGPDSPEMLSRLSDYSNGLMLRGRRETVLALLERHLASLERTRGAGYEPAAKLFALRERLRKTVKPPAAAP